MPTPITATEAMREANNSARTDVVEIVALEITHPDIIDGPIRVTSADQDLSITHEGPAGPYNYTAIPMKVDMPGQEEGRPAQARLTMDNVDRIFDRWLTVIKLSDTIATLKLRFYLYPDTSAPAAGPFQLDVPAVSTSPTIARLTLTVPQIHLKKFPAQDYNGQDFPTLVA